MDKFLCANCDRTFERGWSDDEAQAEAESLIPTEQFEESGTVVVCDDCFKAIMGRVQIEAPELLRPDAPLVAGACYLTRGGHKVHVQPTCRCPR